MLSVLAILVIVLGMYLAFRSESLEFMFGGMVVALLILLVATAIDASSRQEEFSIPAEYQILGDSVVAVDDSGETLTFPIKKIEADWTCSESEFMIKTVSHSSWVTPFDFNNAEIVLCPNYRP